MAKKSWMARERKKRAAVKKYAEKRKRLKAAGDYEGLQKLPRNASPVRLKNRCALTGRTRSYIRKFGVSRIVFRQMALAGKIPGIRKSSW
jgi:small subunit ribosomal protein S14